MSMFRNGNSEQYDEDLLTALEPEGEVWRPRAQPAPPSRRPPQGFRAARQARQPGTRPSQGARRPPQGGRTARQTRQPTHPRGCNCARCRAGRGHVAGCNCARCRRARQTIGRYLGGFAPISLSAPGGADSERVRWVQSTLNRILNLRLPVDGVMSPAVRSAVRDFQRREGLPEDGIVGPPTEAALARAAGGATPAPQDGEPAAQGGEPAAQGGEPAAQGGEELFIDDLWSGIKDTASTIMGGVTDTAAAVSGLARIVDRTAHSPRELRKRERDPSTIDALVLHQMAFSRGNNRTRYDTVKAHFAILPDGTLLQLHPVTSFLEASNGFNTRSIAVEFAGNFPDTRGKCWEAKKFGCHTLTREQIETGRFLVQHLIRTLGIRYILAHRQASGDRTNDPGPDIWYHVGQWAVTTHGLSDGGPQYAIPNRARGKDGKKRPDGQPIPDLWRTWGRARPAPELELELIDPESPEHTRWLQRALNRTLGLRLPEHGRPSAALRSAMRSFQRRQGLPEDGELSDELEGELLALGATPHRHGEDEAFIGDLWDTVSSYFTGGASAPSATPSAPSGGSYTPASPSTGGTSGAALRSRMAAIARQEWERWKRGATKEGESGIRGVLADYWKTGVGWLPSGSTWWSSTPWSAAFISWVVKQAGGGSAFNYSASHAAYTAAAKQNKLAGNTNPFKAYRTSEAAPRVGDIVCKDRGSGATYDNVREGMSTHCDIVVEVQPGKLTTIGGNLSDSVRTTSVTTDAQGRVTQSGYFAVIRVGS